MIALTHSEHPVHMQDALQCGHWVSDGCWIDSVQPFGDSATWKLDIDISDALNYYNPWYVFHKALNCV